MHRLNFRLILLRIFSLVFALILFSPPPAEAAKVTRAKGRLAEIEMGPGEDFVKGDKVHIMAGGKKVGILTIKKTKGKKAIGALTGKAPKGATALLAHSTGDSSATAPTKRERAEKNDSSSSDLTVGVMVGYDMDTQRVKTSSSTGSVSEDISMSGSGFSAKAYGDMAMGEEFGVIARLGVETFKVTGTSKLGICANSTSTSCSTDIMYFSGDLLFRYTFAAGTWNPFVSGGLGIYFPLSKKTNVLDETKIASTTVFYLGGGIHWKVTNSLYVPITVEYAIFPPSNQVSTNFIAARLGLGWRW